MSIAMWSGGSIPMVDDKTIWQKVEQYVDEYGECEVETRPDEKWGIIYTLRFPLHNGEPYSIDWVEYPPKGDSTPLSATQIRKMFNAMDRVR